MADLVKFVSKSELDAKKAKLREAREAILRKAKDDYEKKERELEAKRQRGEDVWMLPSLSKRLSGSSSEDESLKKKKHKSGKKKKKKKKKHKSDSKGDEWVEKDAVSSANLAGESKISNQAAPPQRDSWMLFPTTSKNEQKESVVPDELSRETKKDSKEESSAVASEIGQHPRELNPYWKQGGAGLPSANTSNKGFNSGNRAWFKRAYERAKQQAEDEGRSLEDVAAERWGSLEKLKALANGDEEERSTVRERNRGRDESRGGYKESKHDSAKRRGYERDNKGRSESSSRSRDSYGTHDRDRDGGRDRNKDRGKDNDRSKDKGSGAFRKPVDEQSDEKELKEKISAEQKQIRRNTLKKSMRNPEEEMSTSKSWDKKYESYRNPESNSKTSGRWRKRQDEAQTTTREAVEPIPSKQNEDIAGTIHESSDSAPSSDENEKNTKDDDDDIEENKLMSKRVTEADLNALGAKRLKAELMGNEELAEELDIKLDKLRKIKEKQEKSSGIDKKNEDDENVVVLTRTDRAGNVVPVENRSRREDKGKRRKRHKNVSTHDEDGKRSRYFCDDDDHDLKSLVARERTSTAEDQNATYARLAHKGKQAYRKGSNAARVYRYETEIQKGTTQHQLGGQFDLDDKFESAAASKYTPEELEEKARQKAIREHQRLAAQMENCKYCLDSADLAKHLIIAIGLKVYLALPSNQSLCDGHCFLIPIMHHTAGTMVDEDVWSEIQVFKKGLTKLFDEMGKDVVFMEMNRNLNKKRHMMIECVPVEKEIGELAPIYFKKAILESDAEWAQNKKLIDTRKKNLRSSVPKGLPYFSVEFGLDGGFAHVIENEDLVPAYFGKEIVGGMLELEPFIWKKPRKENFQVQKKKVLQFADWWKPFDWTQRIPKK